MSKKNQRSQKFSRNDLSTVHLPPGTYFVSSASAGCPADEGILKTIKNFCKRNNAKPIILGMRKHQKPLRGQTHVYDPLIYKHLSFNVYEDCIFNKNLYAVDAQINPQQLNPLTGMSRYKYNGNRASIIVASPKMFLQTKAVGNNGLPRIIATTGTVTKPTYCKERIGMLAKQTHKMGGLIVHVFDEDHFIIRPVEFGNNKSMISMAIQYFPNGSVIENVSASGLVLGDLHAESVRPKSLQMCLEQLEFFKPLYTVLHDIVSCNTISHHNEKNILSQYKVYQKYKNLEEELLAAKKVLQQIDALSRQICIVDSNHHHHLTKWIAQKRYINDIANFKLGSKLAIHALNGDNLLQKIFDPANKWHWWHENDDHYIENIHVSSHGHKGVNGRFGNPRDFNGTLGKSIGGHSHDAHMFEDYWRVGTNCEFDMGYNTGPSSWIQANAVIYYNGTRELIIGIPGTKTWNF